MTAGRVTPASDVHQPVFDHLERLTDNRGLFEHALHTVPRREHGYCVDDVARGLVVVCHEPQPGLTVRRLARCYLAFVLDALDPTGACHNRMAAAATKTAPRLLWPVIADQYRELTDRLITASVAA